MRTYGFTATTGPGTQDISLTTGLPKGTTVRLIRDGSPDVVVNDSLIVGDFGRLSISIPKNTFVANGRNIYVVEQLGSDNKYHSVVEITAYVTEAPAVSAPTASPVPPFVKLEGVPLWVYGSSFAVDPGFSCTPGMEFHKLTKDRLGMTYGANPVTTFAASGKSIRDVAERIIGGKGIANAQWLPSRKGIAVIDTWINDLAAYANGPTRPRAFETKDLNGIKANLRSALAYISAGTILENTVGAKTGTWLADGVSNERSGGNNAITSTPGAAITFSNVTFPAEGYIYYLGHTLDPTAFTLASVGVYVDDVLVRTINKSEFEGHRLVEGGTDSTGSAAFKITATPGTHTVKLVHAGEATTNMLVDGLIIPKPVAKRNPVFVIQDALPRGIAGGTYYQPEHIPVLQANWPQLLAAYAEVLTEFPNAIFVETTLNPLTDYGADGLHPNDRGMAKKADELTHKIQEYLVDNRPDSLYAIV